MSRKINAAGLELIKSFEGFRATTYTCPGGMPTIGWGHAIQPGESFQEPISEMQGLSILARDLAQAEAAVERLVTVPLTDNQFAALVSFTFNLGQGNLGESTLLKKLNAGDQAGAAAEFGRWVKAGGQVLEGLVRRRAAERDLFLTPDQPSDRHQPQHMEVCTMTDNTNQTAAGTPARKFTTGQIVGAIGTAVAGLAGAAWAVADAMNYTLPPWAKALLITLGGGQ